jgi:ATP-binding cassette subfamily B protein
MTKESKAEKRKLKNPIAQILSPYLGLLSLTLFVIIVANLLNLFLPRLIGNYIDQFQNLTNLGPQEYTVLGVVTLSIFVFTLLQTFFSIYLAEKIARDMRQNMIDKLSRSSYRFINNIGLNELITSFTSDITNVKQLASQGITSLLTAVILLIGSIVMMLITNFNLGLIAISVLPIIIGVFILIFRLITPLFQYIQKNISRINQAVNENIFGASLIRVLNSQKWEKEKFSSVNKDAKDLNVKIVNLFSLLIPAINFVSNAAIVLIIWVGGNQVVEGSLTLGEFTAFITYFNLLITPIFILGFTSQGFSRGLVSYTRIEKVLAAPSQDVSGTHVGAIKGGLKVENISLEIAGRKILKNVSFEINPGTRTAILGPTGAGKSQLFTILIGLFQATSGSVFVDDIELKDWDKDSFLSQVGIVFQDSLVFKGSLRDNIIFSNIETEENINNAVYTSKLDDFVESLENGLDTQISERGQTLSGGQKQRLMLARSLAIKPKILLLDDFTARVDNQSENEIWKRLKTNYPETTLVSITQKIDAIKDFDQIILLMEGELLAIGTHFDLLQKSPEYKQIYASQQTLKD